ncbi:UvrD-helicase domain-containing protein [Mycolicibacterium arseniciresistens]|uniref:AAA family ATPase n=1 Tax=Mycolicibacterium arseniciresistens TaxID=3062257 RepID=A0ABT8U9J8_9MYCO|nr:UvrD-helicase domain-containing protein [Mycolicibacterium arseniciresistens]MDO3634456.1 AAA family ATPase [Mycolicibacterium arseniciresistens]
MPDIPTLTDDQRSVAVGPLDAKVIVTAGPGTGKTYTLVSRIEHLIGDGSDIAGQEVLSLSFSRAAVGVLRRRVGALSTLGSRVRSATFDSFATRLLDTYGHASLEGIEYDRRIELATELLGNQTIDELTETRHVLVDESQDLTGVRADFVLKLLEITDCGFTVFADQAQAIYDFENESPDSRSFVDRVAAAYDGTVQAMHLTTNFRTGDPQLLSVAAVGELIRDIPAERDDVIRRFDTLTRGLAAAGAITDAAWMLSGAADTAILTRRNSEALAISDVLAAAGVEHQLRRRADDPVIGSWLSRLQHTSGATRLTLPDLEAASTLLPCTPAVTWAALSRAARPRKGVLHLGQVAEHLATRTPPDELIDSGTGGVVVSSIHRAKGLEFDTVLLVPFDIAADDDWLQEARVLYVGLTRARHDLMTLKRVDDGRWNFSKRAQRWRRVQFAGKHRYTTGVEVSGSDAFTFHPAGAISPPEPPTDVCDYLWTFVHKGDSVVLDRRSDDPSGPRYDVLHNGQWVAATTEQFGEVVAHRLDLKAPPTRIEGCRVESIATTALPASVADLLDLKTQLVPTCRIQGVGTW